MRNIAIVRDTKETRIQLALNLDGTGAAEIQTGVGFFDHMLTQTAKHGYLDLQVNAVGDLEIDSHHTVEDVGIVFGQALKKALGDRAGIRRFGHAIIPMDEALALVSVDLGGRFYLRFKADLGKGQLGGFDLELAEEFFQAVAYNAGMNIHVQLLDGNNLHHCNEAIFKAFGRALADAIRIEERIVNEIPSTKGVI